MATFEKRGESYSVRWRIPGVKNPRRYSVPDERTAKEYAAEATVAEARGETWLPPGERVPEVASRPLEDLAVEWLKEIDRTKRPATTSAYADAIQRFIDHVATEIGRTPTLRDYSASWVQGWDAAHQRVGLSVATRRSRVAAVKSWSKWLKVEHPDVCRDSAEKVRAVAMPKAERKPVIALTWDQVDCVIARMSGQARMAAVIQRCTGLRRNEVCTLTRGDISPPVGDGLATLRLRGEITKGGYGGRIVPLSPVLWAELKVWMDRQGDAGPEAPLVRITGPSFGALMTLALGEAVQAEEIPRIVDDVRSSTHLLRKAFTTNLRRMRADPDAVEVLVGHDIGVKDAYLVLEDQMAEAVRMVPAVKVPAPSNVVRLSA